MKLSSKIFLNFSCALFLHFGIIYSNEIETKGCSQCSGSFSGVQLITQVPFCSSCNSSTNSCSAFPLPLSGCFCFDGNGDLLYPQQNSGFTVATTATPFQFVVTLFFPFSPQNIAATSSIGANTLTFSSITSSGFTVTSTVQTAGMICFLVSSNTINTSP